MTSRQMPEQLEKMSFENSEIAQSENRRSHLSVLVTLSHVLLYTTYVVTFVCLLTRAQLTCEQTDLTRQRRRPGSPAALLSSAHGTHPA